MRIVCPNYQTDIIGMSKIYHYHLQHISRFFDSKELELHGFPMVFGTTKLRLHDLF